MLGYGFSNYDRHMAESFAGLTDFRHVVDDMRNHL